MHEAPQKGLAKPPAQLVPGLLGLEDSKVHVTSYHTLRTRGQQRNAAQEHSTARHGTAQPPQAASSSLFLRLQRRLRAGTGADMASAPFKGPSRSAWGEQAGRGRVCACVRWWWVGWGVAGGLEAEMGGALTAPKHMPLLEAAAAGAGGARLRGGAVSMPRLRA